MALVAPLRYLMCLMSKSVYTHITAKGALKLPDSLIDDISIVRAAARSLSALRDRPVLLDVTDFIRPARDSMAALHKLRFVAELFDACVAHHNGTATIQGAARWLLYRLTHTR